ncbi:MAG: TonB family protein [Oligoflexia bacterium]|nr:TonB family protein [Oligoflexia bacterium]
MNLTGELHHPSHRSSSLTRFAFIAFALEAAALIVVGSTQHEMVHPRPKAENESKFIETEMVQLPKEAPALQEEKPVAAAPKAAEPVLSKVPHQGRETKPNEKPLEEQNQTTSTRTQLGPTHGPVAVYSPSPVIPSYLQNADLHTSAVLDFYITAQGGVMPKLIRSSGNEELDAIAINTAKKWQFRPAEKDHQPIDSKVRLRIQFDVH